MSETNEHKSWFEIITVKTEKVDDSSQVDRNVDDITHMVISNRLKKEIKIENNENDETHLLINKRIKSETKTDAASGVECNESNTSIYDDTKHQKNEEITIHNGNSSGPVLRSCPTEEFKLVNIKFEPSSREQSDSIQLCSEQDKPFIYRCPYCPFHSPIMELMAKHYKLHNERVHRCNVCTFQTTHVKLLLRHLREHPRFAGPMLRTRKRKLAPKKVTRGVLKCDMCKYIAKTYVLLNRHKLIHELLSKKTDYKVVNSIF